MGAILAGKTSSHPKAKPIAGENKGDVVEGVTVSFAQLVCPNDQGVVEHRSFASRFWSTFKFFQKVGKFLGEPSVDPHELFVGLLVFVGFVGKGVMGIVDVQPVHLGLAYGLCVLKSGDPGEIIYEGIDQHIYLQSTELWQVVVLVPESFR